MSLKGKITDEFGVRSPAAKFFHFIAKQLHQVQHITDRVHEGKVHEGDWHGLGSVRDWTYVIDGKVTNAKEKFEVIDEENKTIVLDVFDGDVGQLYKLFKITIEVSEDKDNGGSIVKFTYDYEKINKDIAAPYGYLDFLSKVAADADVHLLQKA
ncbi:hypothetical protein RIF29_13702 [Crotalaria pallida]|uniref:Bet v I/Major latex protein domain-containing protein n=1 Tax=Crotalaria pallida TaxID=3830 RepID=A0AAN9P2I5_CROPI